MPSWLALTTQCPLSSICARSARHHVHARHTHMQCFPMHRVAYPQQQKDMAAAALLSCEPNPGHRSLTEPEKLAERLGMHGQGLL